MTIEYSPQQSYQVLIASDWKDYELLDSGDGQKLERYGDYRLVRPEAEAMWKPALPRKEWENAHAVFQQETKGEKGGWQFSQQIPRSWTLSYKELQFKVKTSPSRHIGVFPEQAGYWDWITTQVRGAGRPIKVLNIFGYTGMASLAAALGGAEVTHVDASKRAVSWGKENQETSGLSNHPIRWLVDDVVKFVEREIRRGSVYDAIILDPPKYGHGPGGRAWDFYGLFPALLEACGKIASRNPLFIAMTVYAVKASSLSLVHMLADMMKGHKGEIAYGELALQESTTGRLLCPANFARWGTISS